MVRLGTTYSKIMIQVQNGAKFLATSAETQTSHKVELMVVNYQSYLGLKNGLPQGYINVWITDEKNNNVFGKIETYEDTIFLGNILSELHSKFITKLSVFNPNIQFLSTLNV